MTAPHSTTDPDRRREAAALQAGRETTAPRRDRPPSKLAWTQRPLWQVGLAAALVASAANAILYVVARLAGVPLELTEVFSDHFERMPVHTVPRGSAGTAAPATAPPARCR